MTAPVAATSAISMTGFPLPAPMRRALDLAAVAAEAGEVPVGAVITRDGEIIADELKPGGRTFRLVHHRTTGNGYSDSYARGSFPVPSPDGSRVLFRSDWGNSSGVVYAFVVDLRQACR